MKSSRWFYLVLAIILLVSFITLHGHAAEEVKTEVDLVKIFSDIHVSADQVVSGDAVAIGGNITVDGKIEGDAVALRGNIEVNNKVGGEAVAVLGRVKRGPEAEISGGVTEIGVGHFAEGIGIGFLSLGVLLGWGIRLAKLFVVFCLVVLVMALIPRQVRKMANSLENNLLTNFLVGTGALVAWPIFLLALTFSIIGLPLLPVALGGFFLARLVGYVAIALFIGNRITTVGDLQLNIFIRLALGVIILEALVLLPVISILSWLLITIFALGVVFTTKFGTGEPWLEAVDANGKKGGDIN